MEYEKKITKNLIEEILSKGVRDMPQNPASRGFTPEQIREFYYVPEEETLNLLLSIEEDIEKVINDIKNLFVIVDNLPEASNATIGKIYLVENETSSDGNKYTEFLTIEKDAVYTWERIGLKEINIVYDDELSLSSENPIKNKVVTKALLDRVRQDQLVTINGQSLMQGKNVNIEIKEGVDEATLNEKLTKYQKIDSESLATETKTIVGAINELNKKVGNSSGADIDLSEYVKKTDYATDAKAGVVSIWNGGGLSYNIASGRIFLSPANDDQIKTRKTDRAPITIENVDKAVRAVLTVDFEDTNIKNRGIVPLSDTEKAKAREFIGAEKSNYEHIVIFSLEKGGEPVGNFVFLSSDETALTPTESGHIEMSPSCLAQIRGIIVLTYEGKIMQCFAEVDNSSTPPFIKALNYFTNEGNVQSVEPYFWLDTVTSA